MMRSPSLPVLFAAACALLASVQRASANVLVVAPSGAPFIEIQAAVDVASDGDVILVKSGTYASFAARNRDLSIVADAGHVVQIDGAIRVGALSSTRTLLLSGLQATGTNTLSALARHGLYAHDADGLILVQDCILRGARFVVGPPCTLAGSGVQVERCAGVVLSRCIVVGGGPTPSGGQGQGDGGAGLTVRESSVALHATSVSGSDAGLEIQCQYGYGYGDGGDGGVAMERDGPTPVFVFGARATITGGDGGDAHDPQSCFCLLGGNGGDASSLIANTPALWPQSTWRGGAGGTGTCGLGCGGSFGVPASAMQFAGLARVSTAPTPRVVREQQTVQLALEGATGDRIELVHVERPAFVHVPALQGVRNYSVRHPQAVAQLGTITTANALSVSWLAPELGPGVEGVRVVYQPTHVPASGPAKLGAPLAVVLLDAAY